MKNDNRQNKAPSFSSKGQSMDIIICQLVVRQIQCRAIHLGHWGEDHRKYAEVMVFFGFVAPADLDD